MTRIFVSFRKVDDRATRDRVYHRLKEQFGAEQVFKSGESIAPGSNYVQALISQARECQVMVVLIGPGWLWAHDENGVRLLEREEDWVRLEIRTAFAAGNLVVPVLLGDATMLPTAAQLPPDLADLATRQALRVPHSAVEPGLDRLVDELRRALPSLPRVVRAPESGGGGGAAAAGQHAQVHDSGRSIMVGRDVTGTVVGGNYTRKETHKHGGGVAALAGLLAAARTSRGKAAGWIGGHRVASGISALVIVSVAGVGTAVGLRSGPNTSPQPSARAVASSPSFVSPPKAAASPSLKAGTTIATQVLPGSLTQSDTPYWSDGDALVFATDAQLAGTTSLSPNPNLDLDEVETYDIATGAKVGTFVPSFLRQQTGCVLGVFAGDTGKDVILAEEFTGAIDSGSQETYIVDLVALSAATGAVLWTTPIPDVEGEQTRCQSDDDGAGPGYFFSQTADNAYILDTQGNTPYLVDLDTGTARPEPGAKTVIGSWIVVAPTSSGDSGTSGASATTLDFVTPATGATAFTLDAAQSVKDLAQGAVLLGSAARGYVALAEPYGGPTGGSTVKAYSLPSGKLLWAGPSPELRSVSGTSWYDTLTGSAFVQEYGGSHYAGAGFDGYTGALTWTLGSASGQTVCGATDNDLYISSSAGLRVLNATNGGLLRTDAAQTRCPTMLAGVTVFVNDLSLQSGYQTQLVYEVG